MLYIIYYILYVMHCRREAEGSEDLVHEPVTEAWERSLEVHKQGRPLRKAACWAWCSISSLAVLRRLTAAPCCRLFGAAAGIIVGDWGINRRLAGVVGDLILADLNSCWRTLTAFDTV